MRLDELKWLYPASEAHNQAILPNGVVVWRQRDWTYNVYDVNCVLYERLDPITAQAVLYHLTHGGNDASE
jgi:hypothetical protein